MTDARKEIEDLLGIDMSDPLEVLVRDISETMYDFRHRAGDLGYQLTYHLTPIESDKEDP